MGDSDDRKRDVAHDAAITPTSKPEAIAFDATITPNEPATSALESGETLNAPVASIDATQISRAGGRIEAAPLPEVARENYVVARELARGGMGRILVATDRRLARPVALKELLRADVALADRFEREVRITARLQHPGIVPVYEAGHWPGGEPFYAMKLVTGRSLEKVVQERDTLADRLRLVPNLVQLAEAMAYAHDQRIIHRDLKPANVLVGDYGETVVIDWGLAKDLDEAEEEAVSEGGGVTDSNLTMAGAVVGTPAYMAPEQARGEKVDARADVYALGALMWHVLAGRSPVQGSSIDTVMERVGRGVATRPLAEVEPEVPAELATIVDHAMAADPEGRYPTARELAADLSRFQTGQLVGRHRYSTWQLVRRWVRRHRTAVFATCALLVGAGAVGTVAVRKVMVERDKARASRVAGLEEQGRVELAAGRPQRAAVYFAEAYRSAGEPDDGLRIMLGEAMRAVESGVATWRSDKWISHVAWLDDEHVLAATDDGSIISWDVARGSRTELLAANDPMRAPRAMAAAENGGVVAVLGSRTLVIVSGAGKPVTVPLRDGTPWAIAIAPAGDVVAVAGDRGTQLFGLDGALRGNPTRTRATSLGFTRAGELVVADDNNVVTVNGQEVTRTIAVTSPITCGDRTFATVKEQISELATPGMLGAGTASRVWCGRASSLVATTDNRLGVYDGRSLRFLDATSGDVAAVDPGGMLASIGSVEGAVALYDLASGLSLWSVDAHSRSVHALAFDRGGKRLASAGADGVVHVWTVPMRATAKPPVALVARGGGVTARMLRDGVVLDTGPVLTGHEELVSWVAVSASGDAITAGARDGRIIRWDAKSARVIDRWEQPSAVSDGSIVRDWLAVAGNDGTVHVWHGRDLVAQLAGHTTPVHAVAWNSSGDRLLTAADSTLRIWRQTGELVSFFPCGQTIGKAWWATDRYVVVAGGTSLQVWDVDRGGIVVQVPHGHVTTSATISPALDASAFAIDRVGWTGHVRWPIPREMRSPAAIDAILEARVPWRLVGGALVPTTLTALATDDLIRAGQRTRVYEFIGDTITGSPQSPDFSGLVGAGPVTIVRDAAAAIRSGDRAKASAALAGIDDTGNPEGNLALAWCRHWLGEHAAAYTAARLALTAWSVPASKASVRDIALRFAAWARIKATTLMADAQTFGLVEREFRIAASQTYETIGQLEIASDLVEIPPVGEREPRLRALLQLARIAHRRTDPGGAVGYLETAAKLAPAATPRVLAPDRRCNAGPLGSGSRDPAAAIEEMTEQFAAASFSTFEKTFDHRFARAARKLYGVMRTSYGLDAAFVATCERELDRLAEEALAREGTLDKALLRRAINNRGDTIRACYERSLAIEPTLAGTLQVEFTAMAGGKVERVEVVAENERPLLLELATCVRERIADIGLPRLSTGDSITVNYPLVFQPEPASPN